MTWIDELATNRKMDKTQAETAAQAIVENTLYMATKAGIDAATIADWKTQLDEYGWLDRQEPPSNRIMEADLHVPGKTDLQYDRLAAERWPIVLPWMVKEGRFFWSHGKEREALSTSIVGKFTGWRFEKGLPFVQVGWYKTEDSHSELDDLTWQALQDYHAKTGNWGHVSIDWDPNDKTGNKPQIECSKEGCWKNHTAFGAKGASWVGDEPACPGADVVYASNAKALDAGVDVKGDVETPKDDIPKGLSNTNTIKSNTPKHDEAFHNVAISVKSGQLTVEQSALNCGFCKAFVNGAKSAGASDEIALTFLDTHLKTFLEPEQMTSPTPATPAPAPAPETEKKADVPPAQPQGAAPPSMDLAKLVEEFAKMKGEMEELKAQMEMGEDKDAEQKTITWTNEKGEKVDGYMVNGQFRPIRDSEGYDDAMATTGGAAHTVKLPKRRKKSLTDDDIDALEGRIKALEAKAAPAVELKTAAKDFTTIPTVGMEPSSMGTAPAAQPKGLSLEELGKLSLTAEGRSKLANM